MKVLVTGYKGFIGQNLVNYINDKTDWEVDGFEWGDRKIDFDCNHYDWVIHLGAISSTTEQNFDKIMEQNYEFSVWLAKECDYRKINLQYASSASVYGLNTDFREDAPKDPKSPYAWTKCLFDRWVEKQNFRRNIVQGFRYFNVYGEHEEHKGDMASPVSKFTKQAIEEKKITLFRSSWQYERDFVWVGDVCKLHVKFIKDVNENGIWNIGTGKTVSFEAIAKKIAEKYKAEIREIPMPQNIRAQYQEYTCADLTKIEKHIGNYQWKNVLTWISS